MNMTPRLGKRLKTVFDMAPYAETAADIGCDHAQLAVSLYLSGKASHVFASDIREGPLRAARENLARFKCEAGVSTLLSAGLDGVIDKNVEVYIIAGMGGETIAEIIDAHKAAFTGRETFVLQPQSSVEDLRRYLYKNGFVIDDERLAFEQGHLYTAMRAHFSGSARECEEVYYYIGKQLFHNRDPLLFELIERRIREHEKIKDGLLRAGQNEKAHKTERLIEDMKKLLKEVKR
ncbi:MAG: SAM-dependent methyltransferase [Clostridia bacterium]|nr:SAM-dependent methyltransferase [Clostridia bacterium]